MNTKTKINIELIGKCYHVIKIIPDEESNTYVLYGLDKTITSLSFSKKMIENPKEQLLNIEEGDFVQLIYDQQHNKLTIKELLKSDITYCKQNINYLIKLNNYIKSRDIELDEEMTAALDYINSSLGYDLYRLIKYGNQYNEMVPEIV